MAKTRVIVFTENGARILKNPANFEELSHAENVVINPDLKELEGIPPHLWKLQNGKIAAMSQAEQNAKNKLGKGLIISKHWKLFKVLKIAAALLIGLVIGLLIKLH